MDKYIYCIELGTVVIWKLGVNKLNVPFQVHKLKKRYRESSENIDIDELQGDFAGIHFGLSMEFNIKAFLTIYLVSLVLQMDNALIDDRWISQTVSKLWSQYRRKEHQTGKGSILEEV
ncbi:hypothetical protein C5167_042800 [Papaver somniferum]|uniref:Uncharacterized protein n=1 Tax=Papaver somniferum TaxID=3469 RepID=A0A4Y7L4W6_PAPSO|nr:hypothetical protein C5167_042800 [Papaver somniferum]